MTADTYSTGIGIVLQGTGNNNNNWGVLLDAGLQVADDAIAGTYSSSSTGGALDLSGTPPPAGPSQVRYARLYFNGALASNLTVTVPNLSKIWLVENATTNAFGVYIKTTAGTATQIPQGTMKVVRCDGSNGMRRLDADEVGRFEDYGVTSAPSGMLECDGTAISRTNYPDLYAKIGTTWGVGDGVTTFTLPNLKDTGRFRRSRTGSVAVGTYQTNQNLAHTHSASGTTATASADHTHAFSGTTTGRSADHTHTASGAGNFVGSNQASYNLSGGATALPNAPTNMQGVTTGGASADHTHNYSGTTGTMSAQHTHTFNITSGSSGGTEARPEAAVVLSCIRY